jgi:hypothetical protein
MLEDGSVIPAIIEKRKALSPKHALLVGISGIDASGKGFVTTSIAESLQKRGIKLKSESGLGEPPRPSKSGSILPCQTAR